MCCSESNHHTGRYLLFLYASDRGVFYSLKPSHLPEMKYFISQGLVKDEVIGKNDLDSLDGDANPVLLYYEYKD